MPKHVFKSCHGFKNLLLTFSLLLSLQVLADREWTLAAFREHTEDVFHTLYPDEPQLKVSGLQNEFHFDIPLSYKVDEAMIDTGLVFILEKEVNLFASSRLENHVLV